MNRPLATAAVAATALLTLTGCFRLDLDLAVDAGDVVSGTIVTAVDTEVLEELSTVFADLEDAFPEGGAGGETGGEATDPAEGFPGFEGLADSDELSAETVESLKAQGAQVTVTEYAEDGFAGDEVSFTDLPLAGLTEAFTDGDGEETLEITRDGDTYRVAMVLDLSDAAGESPVEEMDPAALGMRAPEARVSVTLPGPIVEANGEIDGNTVTWELAATEGNELTATATLADETGPAAAQEPVEDSSSTGVVAAVVGGAVLLALVGGLVLARSRRRSQA
ncbi:LppM family (lipo)protein [Nocardioides ochotonae]|uniref:LppM family (lipo)protein n=1 Tax=Nocardioides ochotonae TaxID=2685869 RepID=UPI00140E28BA|nr:hypothetical protein [Nocardioides ochotonae]